MVPPDEYEAAGIDFKTRGARADEALEVLRKLWTDDTPKHCGSTTPSLAR